jgi:hypothetical protein
MSYPHRQVLQIECSFALQSRPVASALQMAPKMTAQEKRMRGHMIGGDLL